MSIEITNILVDVWFQRLDTTVAEKRIESITEAYADARVRAAMEEAAQACEARIGTGDPGVDTSDCDEEAQECAAAIRALIPDK